MVYEALKQAVLEAGIVGAGGAGFPTHVKLVKDMEYLVINAAECEPLLYTDVELLEHYGEQIVEAIEKVRSTCNIRKAVIGVKKKHSQLIEQLEMHVQNYSGISVVAIDNIYPIGDELTLIRACTGRIVQRGQLPSSQGVVVLNVETLWNIYGKLWNNQPVTHTYVTLNGEVTTPAVYSVPIGMKVKDFIKSVDETLEDKLILMGGPMMGNFINKEAIITKTTKGLILLPPNHVLTRLKERATSKSVKRVMSSCSQCRMCTDLCPRNRLGHKVEPHKVMNAFANGILSHYEGIETVLGCCGCNLCSYYSCHHELSPGTLMMEMKKEMLKAGIKVEPIENSKPKHENYLKVPTTKLIDRIGLRKYQVHARLSEKVIQPFCVTIPMSQHVGQPSVCCVKEGECVVRGQLIAAQTEKGLSTNTHSSMDGIVRQVKADCIVIEGERR